MSLLTAIYLSIFKIMALDFQEMFLGVILYRLSLSIFYCQWDLSSFTDLTSARF